jgi:cystathionine gamma-lyase
MKKAKPNQAPATIAIHTGNEPDSSTGAIIAPIFQTSTYTQSAPGVHKGFEYSRSHNPTRSRLEEVLAALEMASHCVTTSSGMAAISLMMHALPEGSRIICGDDVYGGTFRLFTTVFNKIHHIEFMDTSDLKKLKQRLNSKEKVDLIWLESPTNPLLKLTDIKKIAKIAHNADAKVMVDNTFMSPIFQNPLELGADFVMHSLTKFINGHSDVVAGALMTNDESFYKKLWVLQNSMGPCLAPFDCWLILRGIKTLNIRMREHEKNALALARWLEKHPKIDKVVYPGLQSHPQFKIAKSQMRGFGGMITVFVKGEMAQAKKTLKKTKLFQLAESLGGVESLIEHPAIMTHASIPKKRRTELGILDTLIRLSVGIEDLEDLKDDLDNALA